MTTTQAPPLTEGTPAVSPDENPPTTGSSPGGHTPQQQAYAPPQGYPPPGYPQPGYPVPQQAQTKTNGMAIASPVLGILWIYGVGSILALVFGFMAKQQIEQSGGRQTGRGMAIAGIVLGCVGAVGALLVWLLIIGASSSSSGG
jgi:hypothetical protein